MMLRLLVLAPPVDLPPSNGTAVRIIELFAGLSKLGNNITLLAKIDSQHRRHINEVFDPACFSLERSRGRLSYLSYAIRWHIMMISLGLKISFIKKPQLVICATIAPIFPALLLAKVTRVPLFVDVHSLMSKRSAGASEDKLRLYIFRVLEKISCLCADKIIVASAELERALIGDMLFGNKICYVPTGVDITRFHPNRESDLIKKMLGGCPIVLFLGPPQMYSNRLAIPNIYRAAKAVFDVDPNVKFIIVGKGRPLEPIPENVTYTGFVDRVEDYIAAADVAIIPYEEGTQQGIPVKLLEYIACGKPVISTPEGIKNVPGLIENKNCVVVRDMTRMAEAILYLLKNRKKATELGANAVSVAKLYDWNRVCQDFFDIIKDYLGIPFTCE